MKHLIDQPTTSVTPGPSQMTLLGLTISCQLLPRTIRDMNNIKCCSQTGLMRPCTGTKVLKQNCTYVIKVLTTFNNSLVGLPNTTSTGKLFINLFPSASELSFLSWGMSTSPASVESYK
ncbi:hypothetical protein EB796_004153 [Bugula neritina]|uniref:Uncharacterized protein n=1 Tax=Bugula neritina TaxID=10212 RepID=A0A7J7KH16_BUGNE|nr:hypothetical protein EB796_004153 [Bugula neritina]